MDARQTPQDSEIARKVRGWEAHGQTVLMALITAMLGFAAKGLWDANAVQATMVNEIKHLSTQVAKMEGAVSAMPSSYITRAEFMAYVQSLEARMRK